MPTAKREGNLTSQPYQLAGINDDATLAQKRQYWRTKKREQRARLKCTQGKKLTPQGVALLNSQATSPPHVAVPGASVAKVQRMAQISFRIQPKQLSADENAGVSHISPDAPVFAQPEDRAINTTLQTGTKWALITAQRAKGVEKSPPLLEAEEKAAKRREHWRLKKREQRAKLAARLKWREVMPGVALQRQAAQQIGLAGGTGLQRLKPKPLLRAGGLKQCPDDKLQHVGEGLAAVYSQPGRIKAEKPNGESITQEPIASDMSLRKKGALQRKLPSYADLSNVSSGVAPYRTSRQRFAEAQKNLTSQRNTRRKTALHRSVSKTEPGSTYEQIIAKQREYWRLKKREQRAKLSFKGKVRLKESYARALKLHQHLQEEKARLGNARIAVPETIGGFIKEDGTVSANVPAQNTDTGKVEHRVWSETSVDQRPHQSDANWGSTVPVPANHTPPPFRPPQVKVTVKRPQCRLSARAANEPKRTEVSHLHSAVQTVGTFIINPVTPPNGGLKPGGCVLKMAVSNSAPLAPAVAKELTEKERIARKREYWRLKKREQRAACAARVKRSSLQVRTVSEKKNAPEQLPLTVNRPCESQTFSTNSMQGTPNESQIQDESESLGRYSRLAKAPSDSMKLPTSHAAAKREPGLAPDPDKPAFQEESPGIAKSDIKTEPGEQGLEPEWTPDFAIMVFEENESFVHPHLQGESESSAPLSPFPSSCEQDPNPFCEGPFQNPMGAAKGTEPFVGPSSEDKEQRILDKNASHQKNSSPELLKLHQLPFDTLPRLACQEDLCQEANLCQIKLSSAQRFCRTGTKQSGLTGLLKQREYWKLMKRQQRARLKARKSAPRGESGGLLSQRNIQGPDPGANPLPHQHQPLFSAPDAASGSSATPVVHPTACQGQPSEPSDNLQVKLPPAGFSRALKINAGPPEINCGHLGLPQNQQGGVTPVQKTASTEADNASCFSILEPPPNPLCRLSLQPTEPPPQTSDSAPVPAEIPCARYPTTAHTNPAGPAPLSTMVPPKRIPGEPEEDFLRQKREYWRIKKKEQRAKKAIQDKGITLNRASTDLPSQNIQIQGVSPLEESDHLVSALLEADLGSFPYYAAPVEDESELLFGAGDDCEDGPVSAQTWRSCYLMDYDPLNHLLVCIVCGEMQYPPSLTRVRAHIDEAHPTSLAMSPVEKQQILEAWDEEVSRREQFFTSQLQRHGGTLAHNSTEDHQKH